MRLTLRTLLAYLNQYNLNLRAVERIEAKVRSSPAAGKLIEELRKIMADPNIAALPMECDEDRKDANWVAEYLDNSLDEANVESFEKKAFESTPLLGEIADCHEILSAICRNETTVATAGLRQRAYEIGRTPLDQAAIADVVDIEYLGSATKPDAQKHSLPNQFAAEFKQPEVEFRLGPPPEESHKHDEWVDAISSEHFDDLYRKPFSRGPLALFAAAIAILLLAIWLIIRSRI